MANLAPVATPWLFDANRNPPVYTRLVPTAFRITAWLTASLSVRPLVGSELAMQRYWNAFDAQVVFNSLR